jgi:ABC-type transport system substrate-binding protein
VDTLLKAGSRALDPAKRTADFQAADTLLSESVPIVPLWEPLGAIIHKTALHGIDPDAIFASISDWHWTS